MGTLTASAESSDLISSFMQTGLHPFAGWASGSGGVLRVRPGPGPGPEGVR